jgi:hypothetical protein
MGRSADGLAGDGEEDRQIEPPGAGVAPGGSAPGRVGPASDRARDTPSPCGRLRADSAAGKRGGTPRVASQSQRLSNERFPCSSSPVNSLRRAPAVCRLRAMSAAFCRQLPASFEWLPGT